MLQILNVDSKYGTLSSAQICGLKNEDQYVASAKGSRNLKEITDSIQKSTSVDDSKEHWKEILCETDLIVAVIRKQ